nr:unnamed protein product [Callosobruchus analis]
MKHYVQDVITSFKTSYIRCTANLRSTCF